MILIDGRRSHPSPQSGLCASSFASYRRGVRERECRAGTRGRGSGGATVQTSVAKRVFAAPVRTDPTWRYRSRSTESGEPIVPGALPKTTPLLYTPMEVGVILCPDPEQLNVSTNKPKFFIDLDDDALVSMARAEIHEDGVAERLGLVEGKYDVLTNKGRTLTARQEGRKKVKDIAVACDDGMLVLMLHVPPPAAEEPGGPGRAVGRLCGQGWHYHQLRGRSLSRRVVERSI